MAKGLTKEEIEQRLAICVSCVSAQRQDFNEDNCGHCTDGYLNRLPKLRRRDTAVDAGLITRSDARQMGKVLA